MTPYASQYTWIRNLLFFIFILCSQSALVWADGGESLLDSPAHPPAPEVRQPDATPDSSPAPARPATPAAESSHIGDPAAQTPAEAIAGQVVALLPDDIHFRLLGIGAIEGDDGALAEALTAAIKAGTNYHLVERGDLDKLLREQGIQLSPLSDPNSLVEPGRIKGVEGLLMGRVIKHNTTPFFSQLEVFLKLDNVESGDVVFARNFQASRVAPLTWYALAAGGMFLFLLFFVISAKRAAKKRTDNYLRRESEQRLEVEAELKKARDNLNRAHDQLTKAERLTEAVATRAQKEELDKLLFTLRNEPALHRQALDGRLKKDLKDHNKLMRKLAQKVLVESENLLSAARGGKTGNIDKALDELAAHVKNSANRAHNRQAGRA